jgi:diguanylate cyclase (GGDEF)-like protein/PAS domain S-box-containing protein
MSNGEEMDHHRVAKVDPRASEIEDAVPLEQYRLAFERNPQPMWVYDLDMLTLIAVNDAAIAHYGYSRAEFLAMTIKDLRPSEEHPALDRNLNAGGGGFERSSGWRHRRRDGSIIDVEIVSHELTFAGRRARVVLATDVTARRSSENAQRAQLVVAQRLVDSSTIEEAGPKLLDALGSTMPWDAAVIWRLDDEASKLRFDTLWSVPTADPADTAQLEHALRAATLRKGVGWAGVAWESGEPVCEENAPAAELCPGAAALRRAGLHRTVAVPIVGSDGVLGVLEFLNTTPRPIDDGSLRTLTIASAQLGQFLERKLAEQALAYQALHDPLTCLPNRALFLDRLRVSLAQSRRRSSTVAVLFLDVDNFKVINDSLGHRAGDELLSMVATRITAALRPGDTVARFGGDEFVLIADQIDGVEDAVLIAERIAATFTDPFSLALGEHFVTASIGIALSEGGAQDAEDLIRSADSAMYRAKERGRGHYEVFDELMHARMLGRLRTEKDLRAALRRDELMLYYQPVVDLPTHSVVGVEALLRWNHPERGMLAPGEFIGLAEENGLILPIGRWVLHEACRQAAQWRQSRPGAPPLSVSVNVSALQASHGSLDRVVEEILLETGADARMLRLELTESVLLEESESLHVTLDNLGAQGVALVLDDFGTGYSALGYLHRFPIQGLKIDRSFVDGIESDRKRTAIAQAVIDIARALDIEVVGEGVESPAQASLLHQLGCNYAQGFHFARPAPAAQITSLLAGELKTAQPGS